MSLVPKAILFAARHHQYQLRKGTRVPYMAHLMNVCRILVEKDCRDEIVAAGILHDVVEDTPVTIQEVESEFGPVVAELVRGATELDKLEKKAIEKEATWKARKKQTIHFLEHEASLDQLRVSAADKLDNLRNIYDDQKRIGKKVWERFSAPRNKQNWYFGEIARIIQLKGKTDLVLAELGKDLKKLHRRVF
ncbi:HD domain-containing protein [Flavihumibacter stibioxidans]|uniref:HD domain-containing protein n=1 Tax=Flavihumibacter stibioxidans TaxID=1834163 RepID=A0ABR7MAA8_9BACT|nr:HD domain-containing protein [Flavihumibacter stibioxidans]MBC6491498.1 hypothetical protein [Flavihumibacter stibioxidans]